MTDFEKVPIIDIVISIFNAGVYLQLVCRLFVNYSLSQHKISDIRPHVNAN